VRCEPPGCLLACLLACLPACLPFCVERLFCMRPSRVLGLATTSPHDVHVSAAGGARWHWMWLRRWTTCTPTSR
jgi:hypothetical protein